MMMSALSNLSRVVIAGAALTTVAWGQFTAAQGSPVTVGASPVSVAVADFNNDGIPDLAVANFSANSVSILIGNGAGGFTPISPAPIQVTEPSALVAADFNKDGYPDLAIASQGTGAVTIWLANSNGNGGFTMKGNPVPAGTQPVFLTAVNLGSGIGLAVANFGSRNVTVLMNDGTGIFTSVTGSPFLVGSNPNSIAVSDFNHDGMMDLAVANKGDNSLTILLGGPNNSFTATSASPISLLSLTPPGGSPPYPVSLAAADFNGDRKMDLAVANEGQNSVEILLGDGTGNFAPLPGSAPIPVGATPLFLTSAYLNQDTFPDLAVLNQGNNSLTVLFGNGAGAFTQAPGSPYATGSNPAAMAAQDLNGDGKTDFAIANKSANSVTILLNNNYLPITVSAADYLQPVAPGSLISIFGTGFATAAATATVTPLPTVLGGVTAVLTDNAGIQTLVPLIYVGASQINAVVPSTAKTGEAMLTIFNASGSQTGHVNITRVAPSLFSANGTGQGVAAAQFVDYPFRNVTNVFSCTTVLQACVPVPIDVSSSQGQLVLYGTGIANAASVTVNVGSLTGTAVYAGPAPGSVGEDQVNVVLPSNLAGSGLVSINVTLNQNPKLTSNTVTIYIQ
jgi:uncharacterized protein (TIGR03437 family)